MHLYECLGAPERRHTGSANSGERICNIQSMLSIKAVPYYYRADCVIVC